MGKIVTLLRDILPQRITFVISIALFMETVDSSILNTAIPAMAKSLNVPAVDLKLALISYLLSLAVFIPISGWIADKYGIKRTFTYALLIFTVASLLCGLAPSLTSLVCARTLQGIGGSLMMPVGRLVIARTFQRNKLIHIMSHITIIAALGNILGPTLGGYITHFWSWHWIFWVNIPVGLLAIFLAKIWLKESPSFDVPSLDKIGFFLFSGGLAGLTLGLSMLSETIYNQRVSLLIIVVSMGVLWLYWRHSKQQSHPIIKTELFSLRTFQVAILGNLFVRTIVTGLPFLMPLFLQIGLHYPPQTSGLLMSPIAVGVLVIKPFSTRIVRWLGFKRLLLMNTLFVGLATWLFMLIDQNTSLWNIAFLTCLYGFFISMQYTGMNSLTFADVPSTNLSAATSIMSTTQQFSQSLGVTFAATLINHISYFHTQPMQFSLIIFHKAFFIMGLMTFICGYIFLRLRPNDGHQML